MERILRLFNLVRDKTPYVESLSKKLNKNPVGIRANWFSMGKIPKVYHKEVEKDLIKWITKELKKVQQELNRK